MIKAFLFDFDGVLAETFPSHFQAWQFILKDVGIRPDELTVRLHEGVPVLKIAQAIVKQAGISLTQEQILDLTNKKNTYFRIHNKAQVFPQVHKLISKAKDKNLKVGLVTGTTLANIKIILSPELFDQFDYIVTASDTTRGKPFPDPYLMAAEKLGIEPQQCLVFENAPLGIEAAKKAGTTCVALLTTLSREHLQNADVIYRNHDDLLDDIENLVNRLDTESKSDTLFDKGSLSNLP